MTMESILRGKAWVCGDYTDSYQILPEQYWKKAGSLNMAELGKHAMEGVDPSFAAAAASGTYSFIVAGRNFGGGGKSIEHPVYAIRGAGVKAVIGESISRYFFRNAINNGLPVLICEGIAAHVKTGDSLEVELAAGEIRNLTTGKIFKTARLPENSMAILKAGGYIPYTKEKMEIKAGTGVDPLNGADTSH
jgi:3-isopropylmalate/(R)-2-methylmalate dehydratase small subunit